MRAYVHILARLAICWGHLPAEVFAAAVFAAPGIVGFLAGLPYVPGLVASGLVVWWFVGIFKEHVWPDVPPEHQRILAALRDRALFNRPELPFRGLVPQDHRDPRRLRGMRVTLLPHARDQMDERNISETKVRAVLADPENEYPGDWGRTVAEEPPTAGRRSVVKVVYNRGLQGERIVVSVMRGRPRR